MRTKQEQKQLNLKTNDTPFQFTALVNLGAAENCLDLNFAAFPCQKVSFASDTNYITSAIKKFMLDLSSHGTFQNIDLQN